MFAHQLNIQRFCSKSKKSSNCRGFTLIELVVVIAIIAVLLTLFGIQTGTFGFWRDEGFLRRLSETMVFLHRQAMIDGTFYRLEFDFENSEYSVGMLQESTGLAFGSAASTATALGNLSLELNEITSPAIGKTQTLTPPPSFPSLAEPIPFPAGVVLNRVRTPRGELTPADGENPFVMFSPRGFSEFAVLNFTLSTGSPVTVAINSFTGIPQIYRDERDFEWSYGRASQQR